jgi:hypothetical protein
MYHEELRHMMEMKEKRPLLWRMRTHVQAAQGEEGVCKSREDLSRI